MKTKQTQAQKKTAPAAAEQSAYATAVEAYIRFLPRHYTFGFEKLMTAVPEPLTRPGAPLNQVGYRRSLVTPDLLFIVRPNNDTIYGAGYIDSSCRPGVRSHIPTFPGPVERSQLSPRGLMS